MQTTLYDEAVNILTRLHGKTILKREESLALFNIYNKIFNRHETDISCSICQHRIAINLRKYVDTHKPIVILTEPPAQVSPAIETTTLATTPPDNSNTNKANKKLRKTK